MVWKRNLAPLCFHSCVPFFTPCVLVVCHLKTLIIIRVQRFWSKKCIGEPVREWRGDHGWRGWGWTLSRRGEASWGQQLPSRREAGQWQGMGWGRVRVGEGLEGGFRPSASHRSPAVARDRSPSRSIKAKMNQSYPPPLPPPFSLQVLLGGQCHLHQRWRNSLGMVGAEQLTKIPRIQHVNVRRSLYLILYR